MNKRRRLIVWLVSGLLCLTFGFNAWAGSGSSPGGIITQENRGTEINAGVVVDYMGKLRFTVMDQNTNHPIPGASVELFIPSLNRYVLFGLTDSSGIYELDVAYNMNASVSDGEQFVEHDGNYIFDGTIVYLTDNNIQYRVYKAGWLLYPHDGSHILEGKTIPETITVYLYQKKDDSGGDKETLPNTTVPGTGSAGSDGTSFVNRLLSILEEALPLGGLGGTGTGALPKTGVEGAIRYWAWGLVFFFLAGGAIWKIAKLDNKSKGRRRVG